MAARTDLPTLTEVIDLQKSNPGAYEPTAAMPIQDESVPLEDVAPEILQQRPASSARALAQDEELVAQVLARLQPRLEAWVEAKVRHALTELLPVWTESAALSVARDLHAEMPELLSLALDEVHRQRRDKNRG
jgi:predicted house-cleaning noncanonical NTP pyrophosphatase (MazG superfamily)